MKFLIVSGHEGTTGAVSGSLIEEKMTEVLATKVADILKTQGHDATEADFNLYEAMEQNPQRLDMRVYNYILEIHFNATPGARGTEIYVPSGADIKVEQAIMKRMSKWFKLRDNDSVFDGVKTGDYWILKALRDRDIGLLEVAFMDSSDDMKIYLANIDAIAKDIAYGILEGFGIPIKTVQVFNPAAPESSSTVNILDAAQKWAVDNKIASDKDWNKPATKSQIIWWIYTFFKKFIGGK